MGNMCGGQGNMECFDWNQDSQRIFLGPVVQLSMPEHRTPCQELPAEGEPGWPSAWTSFARSAYIICMIALLR